MKKLSFLIILILFSCSDSNQVVRTLNTVDSLINERPDSALRLIETIESSSIKERKNRALYALLCTQASYKNYLSIESDSLINTAVEYYKNSGDIEIYGKALLYRGNVLYENKSFDEAIEAYKEAETITTDIQTLALINSNLGWMYSEQMLPDYAIPRLELAVEYFDRVGQRDNATNCMSAIGHAHVLLKNYNKAQVFFNSALDKARQDRDTVQILQNITSLVVNYNTAGNYSQSKQIALSAIDKFSQQQIPRGLYVWLIRNYLHEGKIDSARYYSNVVKEKTSTVKDSLFYYNMMYSIEKKSKNHKVALDNYEYYTRIKDSIAKSLKGERLLEIEQKYDNQLLVNKAERLETASKIHILLIVCIVLILISLLSVGFIIISRKNRIHRDNLAFIEQLKFVANQTKIRYWTNLTKKMRLR